MKKPTRPVRLVTFDLYDTLMELVPTRWERLSGILTKHGIDHDPEALARADIVAEDFWTETNTILPIRDRDPDDVYIFRNEYMRRWLHAANVPQDEETISTIREQYRAEFETRAREAVPGVVDGYRVFPDVNETMQQLHAAGVLCAVISNADADITDFCKRLDFAHEMDLIVTSGVVGWEKPDTRVFTHTLEALKVAPEDALHIGDQPRSDVVGALATGMQAALIDRYARHDPEAHEVPVYTSFAPLVADVLEVNAMAEQRR